MNRLKKRWRLSLVLSNGSRKNYSENSRNPAARAVCHEPEIITKQPLSLVEYKKRQIQIFYL